MRIVLSLTLLFFLNSFSVAQNFTSDPKLWTSDEFLGFDEIGDCNGETGDISSVFGRVENGRFLLRVTFDNMVLRKANGVVMDNFI